MIVQKALANAVNDVLTFDQTVLIKRIYYSFPQAGQVTATLEGSGQYAPTPAWLTGQFVVKSFGASGDAFMGLQIEEYCKSITFLTNISNINACVIFDYVAK